MTSFSINLPYFSYQQQVSNNGSAAASASATAGGASAAASAGGTANAGGFLNGFNQLNQAAGQQQPMNPMQMMMQMMMGMMQMMMQMLGLGQQQQQPQQAQYPQQAQQPQQAQYPQQAQQAQQPQNPMQAMMGMMMQFMQMMMQMLGLGGPQQQQAQQPTNALQNPQGQFPFAQPGGAAPANQLANNPAQTNPANNNALSKVGQNELDAVKGQDLGALDKDGNPKFLVSQGKDGKYHLYKQKKEGDGKHYKSVVKVKNGSNNLYVKDPAKNKAAAAAAANGGGGSSAAASASSTSFTYNPYTGDMTWTSSSAAAASYSGGSGSSGPIENQGGGKTGSPLILDTNGDGKISAQQGKGVDINGDGKADGAATGGDKMLAMGDIDGDGQISGKEVFGDQTVDPFTGQKVNAKNGFDALNKVAQSAQQHTGIQCIDANGQVDVQKLKQALEQSGKGSLGFISGDNNKQLEALNGVSKIDTGNYTNQQQTGAVQHNQIGSYTDANGNTRRVDDVWFQLA